MLVTRVVSLCVDTLISKVLNAGNIVPAVS